MKNDIKKIKMEEDLKKNNERRPNQKNQNQPKST